jgi:hypothetical protein
VSHRQGARQGIILFTTLLLLIFLMMIAAMLVVSARSSAAVAVNFRMREQALFAATAGVNYAMAKLERAISWKGNGAGLTALSQFQVQENATVPCNANGYGASPVYTLVAGAIHTDFGVAKFYLVFKKPASLGAEPLRISDPEVGEVVLSYISSNNCQNKNTSVYSTFYNGLAWANFRKVPPRATNIICVGKCGNVSRVVEIMAASEPDPRYNSVAISNGDMNVQIYGVEDDNGQLSWPGKWTIAGIGNNTPIVRSNASMSAGLYGYSGGTTQHSYITLSSDGFARANYDSDGHGHISLRPTFNKWDDMNMKGNAGSQLDQLPRLGWNDLGLNLINFPPAQTLNAGTYMVQRDGTIKYYATTDRAILEDETERAIYEVTAANFALEAYSDYGGHSLNDLIANQDASGVKKDPGSTNINITKDINVQRVTMNHAIYANAQVDLTDLVIMKEPLVPGSPAYGMSVTLQPDAPGADPPNLINAIEDSTYGNEKAGGINISGNISGTGAVFSKGNMSFEGKSSLSADVSSGVSIYAKGKVSINSMSFKPTLGGDDPVIVVLRCLKEYAATPDEGEYSYDGNFDAFVNRIYTSALPCQSLYEYMLGEGYSYYQIGAFLGPILAKTRPTLHWAQASYYAKNQQYWYWYPYYTYDFEDADMRDVGSRDDQMTFKGMIYAGRDIDINAGSQSFSVLGGMVAYGGDPDNLNAGHDLGSGNINIGAQEVSFYYDPRYLELLYKLTGCRLKKMYWANY